MSRPTDTVQDTMLMLVDLFRLANDNAREYGHQYREQCDRLKRQLAHQPDPDHSYMVAKPKDDGITTAMSRWRWWTDEAARVSREISTERLVRTLGYAEPDPWYTRTLAESVAAARRQNTELHRYREQRDRTARAMRQPTVPLPRRAGVQR